MSDIMNDDSTHYELTLTAGQAFIAFVLLLFSLGASFAFGVMIGRGNGDSRFISQRETAVVSEASALPKGEATSIVELGVTNTDLSTAPILDPLAAREDAPPAEAPRAIEVPVLPVPPPAEQTATTVADKPAAPPAPAAHVAAPAVPHFVQLLSSGDAKASEALAAKVIEAGYTSAYVERTPGEHGMIFRVRVKYPSEETARAAAEKLKSFVQGEVWVAKQ